MTVYFLVSKENVRAIGKSSFETGCFVNSPRKCWKIGFIPNPFNFTFTNSACSNMKTDFRSFDHRTLSDSIELLLQNRFGSRATFGEQAASHTAPIRPQLPPDKMQDTSLAISQIRIRNDLNETLSEFFINRIDGSIYGRPIKHLARLSSKGLAFKGYFFQSLLTSF